MPPVVPFKSPYTEHADQCLWDEICWTV